MGKRSERISPLCTAMEIAGSLRSHANQAAVSCLVIPAQVEPRVEVRDRQGLGSRLRGNDELPLMRGDSSTAGRPAGGNSQ
jgi:hypothetical protein